MSIHILHIFAKNRDAIAAQKGYSYQQLKTLEDWIESRIAGSGDDIYCDFEDDILSRNINKGKTTFKQIKLYATDFSFSSDSIKKAIAHFFMLYTKGEYAFDQVEFNFETNASIVKRNVKDNDANLLQEWYEKQDGPDQDFVNRIRVRIKEIIGEYIDETYQELAEKTDLKSEIQKAKNIYDNLKDEDFDAFIRCIKWRFDDMESNQAVNELFQRIEELIPKIPLPLAADKSSSYTALLIKEVFQRSMQDEPEDRKLTNQLLDAVLLNAGEQEDKLYAENLQQFKNVTIKHFFPGELQSVINAASYCRWKNLDHGHKEIWLTLLRQYIDLPETPVTSKRRAIYEYLFLKIGHNPLEERDDSPVASDLPLVEFYFSHWQEWSNLMDIENDIGLLNLLKGQIIRFDLPLKAEHIAQWENEIRIYLQDEAAKETNTDRLCNLLELQGHLAHQVDVNQPFESFKKSFEYYRKIPPLLVKAQYYSLARLYAQMKQMIKMLAQYGIDDGLPDIFDEFMREIQPYAEKTGLQHTAAHDYVELAAVHLNRHDLPGSLKALELLHRAKGLWRLEYTKEGYILALLQLSKIYAGLGMTYASKYYALAAFWSTWHFADPKIYKRLHQALGQIQHADYRHGAWMNAVEDFHHYLFAKREFDEKGFDIYDDEAFNRSVFEIATIIYAVPLIHPEMTVFIDTLKTKWGFVWTRYIQPVVEDLSQKYKDLTAINSLLDKVLIDQPLSDVGLARHIRFNALGIDWHVHFPNDEAMTAIGEEFGSFLQIILCEIASIKKQVLVPGRRISISISQGHFQKKLTGADTWEITIPAFDSNEPADQQQHYAYIGSLVSSILQSVSTLSKNEFTSFYIEELLKKRLLGEKALETSAYQRIFRHSIAASMEITGQRSYFSAVDVKLVSITRPECLIDEK